MSDFVPTQIGRNSLIKSNLSNRRNLMFEKLVINLYIFVLKAMMRHSNKSLNIALSIIRRMSEAKPQWSNWYRRVACNVAWEFQDDVAQILNLKRSGYCEWVIYADQPHDYCEDELAGKHEISQAELDEIDAAWEAHYAELDREAEEAMMNAVCPCGHAGHKHEGSYCDGHCTVAGCDCPQFGEPPENYETYTKVYLGDQGDDMGLIAYE